MARPLVLSLAAVAALAAHAGTAFADRGEPAGAGARGGGPVEPGVSCADDHLLSLAPCGAWAEAEGCATLFEEMDLLVVVGHADGGPLDGGDCALPELLPGLDCEDPDAATTPWLAGILGLCDAPFGLGLRNHVPRHLRVAFVSSEGAPRPAPLPAARAWRPGAPDRAPAPPPHERVRPPLDPAILAAGPALPPVPASGTAPGAVAASEERPGFGRRVERPPRSR